MFAELPPSSSESGGTERRCPAISSCRSAARTSRIRRRRRLSQRKNASARFSSVRWRAIRRRSQLYFELLAQSRVESAAVVVSRRGRTPLLVSPPCGGARFADARSCILSCSRNRAWNPPPSSLSRRGRTPLLVSPPCGGARFADARSWRLNHFAAVTACGFGTYHREVRLCYVDRNH